jgi:hypothetical protein
MDAVMGGGALPARHAAGVPRLRASVHRIVDQGAFSLFPQ